MVAWGGNDAGQTDVPLPNTDFVAITAGDSHSLGLKSDGSIVAWGANWEGQTNVPAPNTGFVAVAGGRFHSLAIRSVPDCNANGFPDECDIARGAADDENGNGIPDACEARGDFNGDGGVNLIDYAALFACLDGPTGDIGESCSEEDLSSDSAVDLIDVAFFFNHVGQPPP